MLFAVKTFADYSLVLPKDATLPNFAEKTFTNGHKTSKFVKVFFFRENFYKWPQNLKICESFFFLQKFPVIQY